MGLGQRLTGHRHGQAHDHGAGHITRPRTYAIVSVLGFLGRRRAVYDRLVALAGIRPGDRVLDVGCGTGFLSLRAARAAGPTGRVVGVDPSPSVVEYARRVAPSTCTFHVAEGQSIPEPDASFDVAVSSLAVHHIPPEGRPTALAEMYRLVRPGGRVLIADLRPPRNRLVNRLLGAVSGHAMRHDPVEELRGLVTGAGFTLAGEGDRWPMLHYVRAVRPGA